MDDKEEKTIVEKISDAVKSVVDTAAASARKAMQAELIPRRWLAQSMSKSTFPKRPTRRQCLLHSSCLNQ
jgi:hypothetical protein